MVHSIQLTFCVCLKKKTILKVIFKIIVCGSILARQYFPVSSFGQSDKNTLLFCATIFIKKKLWPLHSVFLFKSIAMLYKYTVGSLTFRIFYTS